MRTFTYSIAPGAIERLTQTQTQNFMVQGIEELEQVCAVKFKRVTSGGTWRFEFMKEWQMQVPALGNVYPNGRVVLASETAKDRWRMDIPFRRTIQTATAHEIIAHPPHFNLGHSNERMGILGTSANSPGPLPFEVKLLQNSPGIGPPEYPFAPIDRRLVVQRREAEGDLDGQFLALKAERDHLIRIAESLIGDALTAQWKKIHAKHKQVLIVLEKLKKYFKQWWAANNHWVGIPQAQVVGTRSQEQVDFDKTDGTDFDIWDPVIVEHDTLYDGELFAFIE